MRKPHKILWIIAALVATTPAAAESEQFDLICTSQREAVRYRVDLSKNEWCFDKCGMVQKIASVTAGTISLYDHQPTHARDARYFIQINRVTGEWHWFNHTPGSLSMTNVKGVCEPAPFSGITSGPTKF